MFRFSLRRKLLFFAIVIAIVPLLIAGRTLIRIAQDELKSAANDQLVNTVREISGEINGLYERAWLAPLLLIRNAIDDDSLGVEEKIALLTHGIADIPDIVALQITIEGAALPLVVSSDRFGDRLRGAGLDPLEVLRVPPEVIAEFRASGSAHGRDVAHIAQTDDWLATVILPLQAPLAGSPATLSAQIDLERLRRLVVDHPFNRIGVVTVVDAQGRKVFEPSQPDLSGLEIVSEAIELLVAGSRIIGVEPYTRPDGEVMLGSFAFTQPFRWAVLVELPERDAYLAVDQMIRSLGLWVALGLAVAVAGAIVFALRISRPILSIGEAATEVSKGNFQTRIADVRSRDEIGDLARRMNEMIVQLNERFQLAKFVSGGTIAAIRTSDHEGVRLGGERRCVTVLFCDIRGYTAFSESVDPEIVVEVLNFYLQHQADIVARHHGDIDKFVGDQIVAVFQGEAMVRNAVACALEIQQVMARLGRERPDWQLAVGIGINTGDVVMGAMGSRQRMDYTVLGDNVNLAARLCSHASPGQTLLTENARAAVAAEPGFLIEPLPPITVKGKSAPVPVYQVLAGANDQEEPTLPQIADAS
jgi:adenylate cyclase